MIDVIGILSSDIPRLTDDAWRYVQRSIDATSCLMDVPTVQAACARGDMQLWCVFRGERLVGVVLTEIVVWPRAKVCLLAACAHDEMSVQEEADGLAYIEAWAAHQGCDYIESSGRRGWARRLGGAGYEEVQTLVRKRLGRVH